MLTITTENSVYSLVQNSVGIFRIIKVKDRTGKSDIPVGRYFEAQKFEVDGGKVRLKGDEEDEDNVVFTTSYYKKIEGSIDKK
ncbi:MAG: hypothetical protein V5A57_03475 [Candidatus Paceibacterota bacterium]